MERSGSKGKKQERGRLQASNVMLELDDVTRLRRLAEMCRDLSIGTWLATIAVPKEVFMTSERTTGKVCLTTKQFIRMRDSRLHTKLTSIVIVQPHHIVNDTCNTSTHQ